MPTVIYLGHSKHAATAEWIIGVYGLEVPHDYVIPTAEFLPDTMGRRPRITDKYYSEGGTNWPDRWLVRAPTHQNS